MRYYRLGYQDPSDAYILPGSQREWIKHDSMTAEEAAEDYHQRHDGWEASWPITIVLVDDEGVESRWSVDRGMSPVFRAESCS